MAQSPLEGMGFSMGLSVANKMVDGVFNEHAANKAFSRQKALLQMQNQMNIDNWRMNNAYNTPERQKERLMAAGLNPDMMYGQQGIAGSFAPPSGASAPSAPQSQMGTTDSAAYLLAAAKAKEAGAVTEGQQLNNEWLQKTMEERIRQVAVTNNWTEEQTAKASQEISMIVGQQNALREQIENLKTDRNLTQKQIDWYDRHMAAEVKQMLASAEYQQACKDLTEAQKKLLDDSMESLVKITTNQATQLETMVGLLQKYGDAQAIISMASQIISSATDVLGMFFPGKKAGDLIINNLGGKK